MRNWIFSNGWNKNKFRNKLQLANSLRLKLTHIDVDINAIFVNNRKQANYSPMPHY